jgi:hypothetical protein
MSEVRVGYHGGFVGVDLRILARVKYLFLVRGCTEYEQYDVLYDYSTPMRDMPTSINASPSM